ncbi:hypothetical protein pb186bvf_020038 [Paramecium bursaria]
MELIQIRQVVSSIVDPIQLRQFNDQNKRISTLIEEQQKQESKHSAYKQIFDQIAIELSDQKIKNQTHDLIIERIEGLISQQSEKQQIFQQKINNNYQQLYSRLEKIEEDYKIYQHELQQCNKSHEKLYDICRSVESQITMHQDLINKRHNDFTYHIIQQENNTLEKLDKTNSKFYQLQQQFLQFQETNITADVYIKNIAQLNQQGQLINEQFNELLEQSVTQEQFKREQEDLRKYFEQEIKQLSQKNSQQYVGLKLSNEKIEENIDQILMDKNQIQLQLQQYDQTIQNQIKQIDIKFNEIDSVINRVETVEKIKEQSWNDKFEQILQGMDAFKYDYQSLKQNYKKQIQKNQEDLSHFMECTRKLMQEKVTGFEEDIKQSLQKILIRELHLTEQRCELRLVDKFKWMQDEIKLINETSSQVKNQITLKYQNDKETQINSTIINIDEIREIKDQINQIQQERNQSQFNNSLPPSPIHHTNLRIQTSQSEDYNFNEMKLSMEQLSQKFDKNHSMTVKIKSDYTCDIETFRKQLSCLDRFRDQARIDISELKEKLEQLNYLSHISLIVSLNNELVNSSQEGLRLTSTSGLFSYEFLPNQVDELTHITFKSVRQSKVNLLLSALQKFSQKTQLQERKPVRLINQIVRESKTKSVIIELEMYDCISPSKLRIPQKYIIYNILKE